LPYLRNSYRVGQDFEDSFREQYAVVSQQRYALPVRLKSASIAGTRTFFPIFNRGKGTELLEEYAEGITSLIDYDALWKNRSQWNVAANNSNESLDMRLREEVFIALEVSSNSKRSSFYSAKGNEFFRQVGQEIIQTYCNRLPPKAKDKQPQIDYLHACFDNNASGIIKIVAKHLKPLVSKNIPPVPAGYM
ncbi:MAG: hypothetical protein J6S61_00555, partial [Elusimicrobiaceae bacterium]|nr:hypothetical protein [Elusimicrobiaceae bacterium]